MPTNHSQTNTPTPLTPPTLAKLSYDEMAKHLQVLICKLATIPTTFNFSPSRVKAMTSAERGATPEELAAIAIHAEIEQAVTHCDQHLTSRQKGILRRTIGLSETQWLFYAHRLTLAPL